MSNTIYYELYYHIVWSTKHRQAVIPENRRGYLQFLLIEDCRRRGAKLVECKVMPDHVHIMCSLPPTVMMATYIGQIKGASAYEFNKNHDSIERLSWQQGYGIITIRETDVPKVSQYIKNQDEIHAARKALRRLEATEDT